MITNNVMHADIQHPICPSVYLFILIVSLSFDAFLIHFMGFEIKFAVLFLPESLSSPPIRALSSFF